MIQGGGHLAKVAENRPNAERRQRTLNCANVRFPSAVCRRTIPKDPRGQGGPTIDPAARFVLPLIDEVPDEAEAASIDLHSDNRPALIPGTFRAPTILVIESEVPPRNRPGRPRSELDLPCTFSTRLEYRCYPNRAAPAASPTYNSGDTPPLAFARNPSLVRHYIATKPPLRHYSTTTQFDRERRR